MLKILRILGTTAFLALMPFAANAAGINTNPDVFALPFDSAPDQAMQMARERVAAGDLDGAVRALATYVHAHPKEAAPARLLGDLYYRQGNFPAAELTYSHILIFYPYDRETFNRLGSVYATENRVDDAIAAFNKSLPGTDSIGDLVRLHQRKGDLLAYKASVEREASLAPSDTETQAELGEVYYYLNNFDYALRYLLRSIDDNPRNTGALNYAGLSYLEEFQYDKAVAVFSRCLQLNPSAYDCLANIGAGDLETGKFAEAEAVLDRAVRMRPELPNAYVNQGYIKESQGDWKGAIALYLRALAVSPYARDAYQNLASIYEKHGLYELAESALIKGLTVAPNDGALHYLLGRTYEDQSKRDLAVKQYEAANASGDPLPAQLSRMRISALGGTLNSPGMPHN